MWSVLGLVQSEPATAACLVVASRPDNTLLVRVTLPDADPRFTLTYIHSVTRTPVTETYRVDGATMMQTSIRFQEHGPGLPTGPGPGESWQRDGVGYGGGWLVTMQRPLPQILMRVDAGQSPQLVTVSGVVDLAQWGNRALALEARTDDACGSR